MFALDSVLRAFEKLTGTTVSRTSLGSHMGAIGTALYTRTRGQEIAAEHGVAVSSIIGAEELAKFDPIYSTFVCTGCDNACALSVVSCGDHRIFVSGNRCTTGASIVREESLKLGEHDILGSSSMIPRPRGNRRQRHVSEIGNGIVIPGYERSFSGGMVGGGGSQGLADEPRRVDYYALQLERDRTRERKIKIIAPTKYLSAEDVARKQQAEARADQIRQEEAAREARLRDRQQNLRVVSSDRTIRADQRDVPNLVAAEQESLAAFKDTTGTGARANVVIGLPDALACHGALPFWHRMLNALGYSVMIPDADRALTFAALSGESVPSESMCDPARIAHRRIYEMIDRGATGLFMVAHAQNDLCPVFCGSPHVVANNVPAVAKGEVGLAAPQLLHTTPANIAASADDTRAICEALASLDPTCAPTLDEVFVALNEAQQAQSEYNQALDQALKQALAWLSADEGRQGAVLAGRPYQLDNDLLHSIDSRISSLGCAVITQEPLMRYIGAESEESESAHRRNLARLSAFATKHPQLALIFLQAFNCGYDALAVEEACATQEGNRGRHVVIKLDEASSEQHIDILLRTLMESVESGAHSAVPNELPPDMCHTMTYLYKSALAALTADPSLEEVLLPRVCSGCLSDGLAGLLSRRVDHSIAIAWDDTASKIDAPDIAASAGTAASTDNTASDDAAHENDRIYIGIVGNPMLCFDTQANGGIVELIEKLGAHAMLPEPINLYGSNARYEQQMAQFAEAGVDAVLYLRNYNCLRGHIDGSGNLQAYQRAYPTMPVTVLDVDPQSSALNRENRIRLVISSAAERKRKATA